MKVRITGTRAIKFIRNFKWLVWIGSGKAKEQSSAEFLRNVLKRAWLHSDREMSDVEMPDCECNRDGLHACCDS